MDGSRRTRATSIAAHLAAACGLGLLVWVVAGRTAFVNYDSAWSLNWMRELLAGGTRPDLERLFSPTPHPLSDLLSGALVPLSDAGGPAVGRGAETALIVLALFWIGALGVVTFRLGAAWFGPAAGVVAALLVLTREPVLSYGLRTYLDLPYAVFLLLALLAETRRPRNGARTLAWITLAGLLRPEAWLLAAAYVGYLAVARVLADRRTDGAHGARDDRSGNRRVSVDSQSDPASGTVTGPSPATPDDRDAGAVGGGGPVAADGTAAGDRGAAAGGAQRPAPAVRLREVLAHADLRAVARGLVPLVALALVAPLGWLLEGFVLAGEPLQALTGTQQNAADLDRVTGVRAAVEVMPRRLGEIVREPVLLAALGGIVLSLSFLRRRAILGVGAGIAAAVAFFALAAAGLPLLTRYLVFPATLLVVFAAAGLLGWRHLAADHRWRRPWQAFAVVALLVLVAFVPNQTRRLDRLGSALELQERVIADLRAVSGDVVAPALTADRRCAARGADLDVALPNHRAVPQVLLWLGRPEDGPAAGTAADERGPDADPYPAVGALSQRVGPRAVRPRVTLLPSSERVARGFILDRADRGAGLPAPPRGSVRAGTHGTWTVFGADAGCAAALRGRLRGT